MGLNSQIKKGAKRMVRRGFRGWEVFYQDGTSINEEQAEWKDIPKNGIKCLTLHYDGRMWHIADKQVYFQKKTASVIPGIPDSFQIEARTIGYYEATSKVMYTVDEHTGRMNMEVKDII
jgi:hypothetical protein